jgi:hypothetical protein
VPPFNEQELAAARALLEVDAGVTKEALQRRYLQRSYALIRSGAPEAERGQLRRAHDLLAAQLSAPTVGVGSPAGDGPLSRPAVTEETALRAALREAAAEEAGRPDRPFDLRSFESPWVRALVAPLVVGLAVLVQKSFLGFFLMGLHVWIHEFGHAIVGWLRGRHAAPLPIGMTFVDDAFSNYVYGGGLLLFGLLVGLGIRERKLAPVVLGLILAAGQTWATWFLSPEQGRMWLAFGGVGGEFVLAAVMMGLFYFELPEWFRWGGCRYVFLFIGTGRFFETYRMWKQIKRGEAGIPYGSMVAGEEDEGGDMNVLHHDYKWTQHRIIHTYNDLGDACLIALVVIYLIFALGIDRWPARLWARWREEA